MEFQEIDAKGIIKIERCTTATYPTTAYYEGRLIFNTDTDKMYYGTGAAWVEVNDASSLASHIAAASAHGASGNIVGATTLSNAITAHNSVTSAHGASGNVVGETTLNNAITAAVTGTPNYIPKFTGANVIRNSIITDDGGTVSVSGTISASSNIIGAKVYNAVWNDIADFLEIEEELNEIKYGCVYIRTENNEVVVSQEYCEDGIIGIATDTYGYGCGKKDLGNKELPVAIGGFVLAKIDKIYRSGTPLTCGPSGVLMEMLLEDRRNNPHKLIATFYKAENEITWNGVNVDGRHWVKVR